MSYTRDNYVFYGIYIEKWTWEMNDCEDILEESRSIITSEHGEQNTGFIGVVLKQCDRDEGFDAETIDVELSVEYKKQIAEEITKYFHIEDPECDFWVTSVYK